MFRESVTTIFTSIFTFRRGIQNIYGPARDDKTCPSHQETSVTYNESLLRLKPHNYRLTLQSHFALSDYSVLVPLRLHRNRHYRVSILSSLQSAYMWQGGRTAHDQFKSPLTFDAHATCITPVQGRVADLLKATSLIVPLDNGVLS
ncbi:hypothetical protein ROZALSC1DRAFT_21989 [Rozella allomycis CSF55]|uniref:Uncharacterized protein n=1 Tax=Rozella allomycis (strain CSF55) TaxID=988480 RepID=A0A4P9YJK1_ROZAC|nr:hypothetical protein ROZALSC1DRAFT_21989 [Rozella allomycis CSF55]